MVLKPGCLSVPRKRGRPRKETLAEVSNEVLQSKERKKNLAPQKAKRTTKRPADYIPGLALDSATLATRVQAVLLELMAESESDAVRVSAAKTLLDKMKIPRGSNDNSETNDTHAFLSEEVNLSEGSGDLVREAALLLEQLAASKSGGVFVSPALDQGRAACANNATGELADLADHGRPRVGEDKNGS